MDKNDWYEAGEEIKNLVQNAVEQQDFSQLSETITKVVGKTVDGFQEALKDSLNGKNPGEDREETRQNKTWTAERGQYTNYHEAADRIRREMEGRREEQRNQTYRTSQREPQKKELVPYNTRKVPGQISGTVMAALGYSFGGIFGLALMILWTLEMTLGAPVGAVIGMLGVMFGVSIGIGIGGSKRLSTAKRFRRYVGLLKNRTYCTIEELASGIGKKTRFVRKDLTRMIQRGFFPEGHLDRLGTCLMTDNETYQQYLLTQQEYDRRQEVQKQETNQRREQEQHNPAECAENTRSSLSKECRELIEEGNRYIRHIRRCNDLIPGEEISAKLDRLEAVVTKIFLEVEKRPELAPELRKMMSYYLPTTQKLIDAYCELDSQTIRGQNIESTKKEIEEALDTINLAFENLLDSFFENTAWDISSDISVLHTMLAQEGLTGKDFDTSRK